MITIFSIQDKKASTEVLWDETQINVTNGFESYDLTADELYSACALFINTKKEMEEDND